MIIQTIAVNACTPQTIVIGRRATYDTLQVVFDLSYLAEAYGSGAAVLAVKRSQDETAYPAIIAQEGNTLTWTISETDTYYVGAGECELMWYVNNGLAKTIIYPVVVMRDILATSEEAPDAYENWVESLTALGAETQQHALDAAQSATEAETAQGKAEDAQAAAEDAQGVAEEAARKAEEASAHAPIIVNGYWYAWDATTETYQNTGVKAEGRDGTDGFSPIITITDITGGHRVTITDADGTQTVDVMNGTDGTDGNDGFSPTVTITTITGGHRVTITDKNGAHSFDVMDGEDGASDAGEVTYDDTATYPSGSVGAALTNQKNAISQLESTTTNFVGDFSGIEFLDKSNFESGSFNSKGTNSVNAARLRTVGYFTVKENTEIVYTFPDTIQISISYFSAQGTERLCASGWTPSGVIGLVPKGANYGRIAVKNTSDTNISVSDLTFFKAEVSTLSDGVSTLPRQLDILPTIVSGGLDPQGLDITNASRLRSYGFFQVSPGEKAYLSYESTYANMKYAVSYYADSDYTLPRIGNDIDLFSGDGFVCPDGTKYIRILFLRTSGGQITPADLQSCELYLSGKSGTLTDAVDRAVNSGYSIGSDFIKNTFALKYLGALPNKQAFCKYDGKYYSPNTEGSLTVLDSSFTEIQTVSVSLGHANGMQVGILHPNYAYVSGWDDQSVYVLDLDNLTVVDTITLPTTGYTTVATDDARGMMYIFQRDTTPSTESFYNFITYDYVNETVISTVTTPIKFGAMQDCILADDKIIVMYGIGTQAVPSGAFVCNTSGDILSTYHIPIFTANEPEGVNYDPATGQLLMSIYNNSLSQTRVYELFKA